MSGASGVPPDPETPRPPEADDALRAAYARLLDEREAAGSVSRESREGHPSPEALLALARREGSEAERLRTLDHAMACPACMADLGLLRAAEGERPAASSAGVAAAWRQRWWRPVAALAAGIVVVVGLSVATRPGASGGDDTRLRGGEPRVTLLAPERAPGGGTLFRWRAVAGAERYRVELFDDAGATVASDTVRDTTATLAVPAGARGRGLLWTVTALLPAGRELRGAAARLTTP